MNILIFLHFIKPIKSQKSNPPSFFVNSEQSNRLDKINSRINADITISSGQNSPASGYRELYDHFYCTVTVTGVAFQNCYAFGSNIAGPNGGAIYCFASTVLVVDTLFSDNSAADGGAICFIQCQALIKNKNTSNSASDVLNPEKNSQSIFTSNTAYYSGGAILFEGNKGSKLDIISYLFNGNKAHQTGGAIHFELDAEINLQYLVFKENEAGDQGGAVFAKDTSLNLFNSILVNNTAGNSLDQFETPKDHVPGQKALSATGFRFRGRGCGGIAFISEINTQVLYTQQNCFAYNIMKNGITRPIGFTNISKAGNDIMYEDQAQWHSIQDYFPNYREFTPWLFLGTRDSENDIIIYQPNNSTNYQPEYCGLTDADIITIANNDFTNYITETFARSSNKGDDSNTSSLPPPSTYTYVATPITRLPNPTTSSHSYVPTTRQDFWSSNKLPANVIKERISVPVRTLPPLVKEAESPPILSKWEVSTDSKHSVTNITTTIYTQTYTVTQSFTYLNFDYVKINVTNYVTYILKEIETQTVVVRPEHGTQTKTTAISYVNTSTVTLSESYFQTDTFTNSTLTKSQVKTETVVLTKTWDSTLVEIHTYIMSTTFVETDIIIPLSDEQTLKDNKSPTIIIIWSVIGCIVVFCLAVIGLFLYRKTHSESSASGSESLDDDDVLGDETKFSNQIVEFTQEDDSNMLSTFNGEPEIEEAPDEDEVFLNGEF